MLTILVRLATRDIPELPTDWSTGHPVVMAVLVHSHDSVHGILYRMFDDPDVGSTAICVSAWLVRKSIHVQGVLGTDEAELYDGA